jgi:hypothetical protein
MSTVTVGRENSADIEIHYEDHAAGTSRSRPCWRPATGSSPTTAGGSALPASPPPAARVAIATLTMTGEKDIPLQMKDGHV